MGLWESLARLNLLSGVTDRGYPYCAGRFQGDDRRGIGTDCCKAVTS